MDFDDKDFRFQPKYIKFPEISWNARRTFTKLKERHTVLPYYEWLKTKAVDGVQVLAEVKEKLEQALDNEDYEKAKLYGSMYNRLKVEL